jgi:transposase-like protein
MNRLERRIRKISHTDDLSKEKVREFVKASVLEDVRELLELSLSEWAEIMQEKYDCYRNGYYTRSLISEWGDIRELKVPRFRQAIPEDNPVFPKSSRYSHGFLDSVIELFCKGLSTWSIASIHDDLISSMSVSRRVGEYLLDRITEFKTKPIERTPHILVVDGIWLTLKNRGKCVLLCAVGIDDNGFKEVIHFSLYDNEGKDSFHDFFSQLMAKGLVPEDVTLVVSDCIRHLKRITKSYFPNAQWQRCIFHFINDIGNKGKNRYQKKKIKRDIGWVFKARSIPQFWNRWERIRKRWRRKCPEAVRIFELGVDDAIIYFEFPKYLWTAIRTTNAVESTFSYIRRRIHWMGAFNSKQNAEKMAALPIMPLYTK